MRAAIYARVSSIKQRDTESIKSQVLALTEYVARQGWSLHSTYCDDGKSAKTGKLDKRDAFARLLADAEAKRFEVLVVLDISRLTRTDSIEERAQIFGPLQRFGIRIYTPNGGEQDLNSFMGQFWSTFGSLISWEENRKRAEAIKSGKDRAIAEGRKPAGPTLWGYAYDRYASPGLWWTVSPTHGPRVSEIFERIRDGATLQQVADWLIDQGIERPQGGEWRLHNVRRIIIHPTYYTGELVVDKQHDRRIKVPTIVSEELWFAANKRLARDGKRGGGRTFHHYLLQDLAVCGLCGAPIHLSSHGNSSPTTYVCKRRKEPPRGSTPCTLPRRPVAAVDEALWSSFVESLSRRDLIAEATTKRSRASEDQSTWSEDLKKAEAQLARHNRAEASILARFREGRISEAAMDEELKASERARTMLERQVETTRRAAALAANAASNAKELGSMLERLRDHVRGAITPAQKQRLFRALMGDRKVTISPLSIRASVLLQADEHAPSVAVSGSAG
jgi:DNA invertase Pin-like site-specific DNA recombinase